MVEPNLGIRRIVKIINYFRGPNMKDIWRGYKISNNRFYRVLQLIHEYLNK